MPEDLYIQTKGELMKTQHMRFFGNIVFATTVIGALFFAILFIFKDSFDFYGIGCPPNCDFPVIFGIFIAFLLISVTARLFSRT